MGEAGKYPNENKSQRNFLDNRWVCGKRIGGCREISDLSEESVGKSRWCDRFCPEMVFLP